MADRTMVLPGMEVYGTDDAFIGVVERVGDDGFLLHDEEIAFDAVARVERDRLYLRGEGTNYHPQARPDNINDQPSR